MRERVTVLGIVVAITFFSAVSSFNQTLAQEPQCNGLAVTILGSDSKDILRGTSGDDVIMGLGGNDIIYGRGGNDTICGGTGDDRIYGGSGSDLLLGEVGSERFHGGNGIDTCDLTSEDKRKISCELTFEISPRTNDDSLQKQVNDLQNQIKDMIIGIINWSEIQGVPPELMDGDNDALAELNCSADQMLQFDGEKWICVDESISSNGHSTCTGEMIDFEGLKHGASLNEINKSLESAGVSLSATAFGSKPINTVIIYDSDINNGKDKDLQVGIGNLAIIPDNVEKPSDNAKGGKQVYEFNPPRGVQSLVAVDIESDEVGTITAYDEKGKKVYSGALPETGNKDFKTAKIDAQNVSKLVIEYSNSGAVTDICLPEPEEAPLELQCEEDQILMYDGAGWTCQDMDTNDNDTLASLQCNTDQIIKWNGTHWECIDEVTNLITIPIFFQHSSTSGGVPEWVGTTNQIFDVADSDKAAFVITSPGVLSNLMAKTGTSGEAATPGPNESFTMTIIKNGVDTPLSCIIANDQSNCSDTSNKIDLVAGDTIILRVDPSFDAPLANIRTSAHLSPQ